MSDTSAKAQTEMRPDADSYRIGRGRKTKKSSKKKSKSSKKNKKKNPQMSLSRMNKTDYVKILEYYGKSIPENFMLIKKDAEKIMASKLCKCIKKVDSKGESRAISICSNTIFGRKGVKRGTFTCKGKQMVNMSNKTKKRGRI